MLKNKLIKITLDVIIKSIIDIFVHINGVCFAVVFCFVFFFLFKRGQINHRLIKVLVGHLSLHIEKMGETQKNIDYFWASSREKLASLHANWKLKTTKYPLESKTVGLISMTHI